MFPNNVHPVLIVGESLSSDLFQIAITYAEAGQQVWFVSPEPFNKVPSNIKPPDKEVLKLIIFMYLKDFKDLITQLNGIHLWRQIPNVIIVTSFEHYSNCNPVQGSLIMTCLLDSAAVCGKKKNQLIKLLVTCSKLKISDLNKLQVLRDLYFKNYIYKNTNSEFMENVTSLFE